jgi:hypothetical protein
MNILYYIGVGGIGAGFLILLLMSFIWKYSYIYPDDWDTTSSYDDMFEEGDGWG